MYSHVAAINTRWRLIHRMAHWLAMYYFLLSFDFFRLKGFIKIVRNQLTKGRDEIPDSILTRFFLKTLRKRSGINRS